MLSEKIKKKIDLDPNEAKIYMAVLELGQSLVTRISQKAGVNRTTCYDILERLVKYNLVTYASGKNSKKKYSPMPPYNLVNFLERKINRKQGNLEDLKKFLPQLQMLYKEPNKPTIKFFEGTDGIKAIYRETLKAKKEILSIGDTEEWDTADLSTWVKKYNHERFKKKIFERILIPEISESTKKWMKNYPTTLQYTAYKILPANIIKSLFHGEINIFDDKVVVVLLRPPNRLGVMITSQDFANILKALYEMAWLSATNIKPKK